MIKEFYSRQDLERNFQSCLVDYGGKLYYTSLCPRKIAIQLFPVSPDGIIQPEAERVVDFNGKDKDIILKTPKLGWIFYGGGYLFLFRNCRRQYLFGASGRTVEYSTPTSKATHILGDTLLESSILASIQAKEKKYQPGVSSMILDNRYAVINWELFRERERIGKVSEEGLVKFTDDFIDTLTLDDVARLGLNED